MGNFLVSGVDIGDEESGWLFNLLAFCDRETRAAVLFISKRYYEILTTPASFRWRLERLHIECGVYFPSSLPKDHTWKSLFLDLDKKHSLWDADDDSDTAASSDGKSFKISVYARFKPLNNDRVSVQNGRKSVLPLHQRLALIRIDKGLSSNSDALGVLKEQGSWFKDKWEEIEPPLLTHESVGTNDKPSDLLTCGIKHIDEANSRVIVVDKDIREFEFDGVMNDSISQKDVYSTSTHGLVCDVINGVSATCLVYGQTGSGKTFTMFGDAHGFAGIVPRACEEIMTSIEYRRNALNLNIECEVCVSSLQLVVVAPLIIPFLHFGFLTIMSGELFLFT